MLDTLLEFRTIYDIQSYMTDRHARDFRDFEAATADEVFQGVGVIATRNNIVTTERFGPDEFLVDDVGMGSHETGGYIAAFPLQAASASYVFTLLEGHGDDIAGLVNPGSLNRNKAWHEDIKGFAALGDPVQVDKAREAFAKHFGADANAVPEIAARRIIELKRDRNAFAHDGDPFINFKEFHRHAVAIVCHIAFLVTNEERLSVYPWEDHEEQFSPQSS